MFVKMQEYFKKHLQRKFWEVDMDESKNHAIHSAAFSRNTSAFQWLVTGYLLSKIGCWSYFYVVFISSEGLMQDAIM